MTTRVIRGIGIIIVSLFGLIAFGETSDIGTRLSDLLEQKGEILATYQMTSGIGFETFTVLKKPVDARVLKKEYGTPAKIEKDVAPFLPDKSAPLTPPKKGEIWQYGRIDLFVREGKVLQFALWKDARESRMIAHLARLGEGVKTSELIEGTEGSPDRVSILNKPVDVNDIVQAFSKPDRIDKNRWEFYPTQRGPFGMMADRGDLWVYGRITLFVKDKRVRQFAEWDPSIPAKGKGRRPTEPEGGTKGPRAPFEEKAKLLFPVFTEELVGQNPVRVRNPNDFAVLVGIRFGKKGKNFTVPANGIETANIPNGKYEIYFVYSTKPDALFQGDSFTLYDNGVEIQIVRVVDGNYNIRQVK